ncbi:MAG: PIN domain-containing protein [Candidatus Sulfotelmatobacter sp.]
MKWLADTSVLVPVFIPGHIHHERSFQLFSRATVKSAFCAAHSIAEVYATMTRLPGKHRTSAQQALTFLEMIEERSSFVALDVADYLATIREAAALQIIGGTSYDALVAACALKAKADVLYTWNSGHFLLLGDEVARKVRTP